MRPDGRYRGPVVEIDPEVRSEADQVRDMKRGTIPVPTAVVIAFITAVAGIATTYLTVHNEKSPGACLTKDEFNESMRIRDEQLRARLDGIETSVTLLLVRTDPRKP